MHRRPTLSRTLVALVATLICGAAGAQPVAPPATSEPAVAPAEESSIFGQLLGGLTWGMDHEKVMAVFEKGYWEEFRERKKAIEDTLEIDQLRGRTEQQIERMRAAYVQLTPGTEAYRVSIIESEFKTGTNESVFRIDDAEAQRYYFFINDRLWKVIYAYNDRVVRAVPFAERLRTMKSAYGKPAISRDEIDRSEQVATGVLSEYVWEDARSRLRLADRTSFFGSYTVSITSRADEDRIGELRGEIPGLDAPKDEVDPAIQTLLGDIDAVSGAAATDEDVIDDILGEPTVVNVSQTEVLSEDDFVPIYEDEESGEAPPEEPAEETPSKPLDDAPIIY